MFRRILFLAAVVVAVAATSTAQAGTPAAMSVSRFEGIVANPCNGRFIDITGTARFVYRNDEKGRTVLINVIAGLKAVDTLTGETYILNDVFTYVLNLYTAGIGYDITWQLNGTFVGGSSSFRSKVGFHTTVTPSGSITAAFGSYELMCM